MCYDVRYLTKRMKDYAERMGEDPAEIDKMGKQLRVFSDQAGPVYHTTAFDHWKLPVITNQQPKDFQFFQWGLIPHFVKNYGDYQAKYATRYLNSRIETLFEEKLFNANLNRELDNPFYKSAVERRCVVVLDGYYDWHWQGKNSYNFHVLLRSEEPMLIAGIWRTWKDQKAGKQIDTVNMVTTDANELCKEVHNRPKASEGPRQLAVLDRESTEAWLEPDASPSQLRKAVKVFPANQMKAYPVKKLFYQDGRRRIPLNDAECTEKKNFPELEYGQQKPEQGSLF